MYENEFKLPVTVDVHDVDFNGICKTSAILRYFQSAAEAQLAWRGIPYEVLKERGLAFIISKIKVEIDEPIFAGEKLIATTYPVESRGFSFIRCYRLLRDDRVIAKAYSVWALVNINNRHLVKVCDFELGLPTLPPIEMDMPHLRLPGDICDCGEYTVCYADIDRNIHVNNTRYADIIANFLPMEGKRCSSIMISYQNEARPGERLSVSTGYDNEHYYVRTTLPGGATNCESEITLCDII